MMNWVLRIGTDTEHSIDAEGVYSLRTYSFSASNPGEAFYEASNLAKGRTHNPYKFSTESSPEHHTDILDKLADPLMTPEYAEIIMREAADEIIRLRKLPGFY